MNSDEPLLDGLPVIGSGQVLEGRFFPLLTSEPPVPQRTEAPETPGPEAAAAQVPVAPTPPAAPGRLPRRPPS